MTRLIISLLSFSLLIVSIIGLGYLYLLAFASLRRQKPYLTEPNQLNFAVAIPAHNEEEVIARSIQSIHASDYPSSLLDVFVVADHCTDNTVQTTLEAGARTFEWNDGERVGKGAALAWLFQHIFTTGKNYHVVAIFDADTKVHPDFIKVMSTRFTGDVQAIQGNHVIKNPQAGWFPALTWAMFLIDNRVQNLGRANLGFSAKNMGDSICFQAEFLKSFGWGEGLTEDYALRQKLLLHGINIEYEPNAIGYGDAPANWQEARTQRARWLRGAHQSSRKYSWPLLIKGLKERNVAMLDGAFQAYMPSYSSLSLLSGASLVASYLLQGWLWSWLPSAWIVGFTLAFLFPFWCLVLERAPLRAFMAILTGPVFILWRTWLSISARFFEKSDRWVRTSRHV